MTSPQLVLLFGTPRSGTSWLGKIFDSHPLTLYKHEPDRTGFGVPFAAGLDEAGRFTPAVRDFVARLSLNNAPHVAARLPVFAKEYRSRLAEPIHRFTVLASESASSFGCRIPVFQCANIRQPKVRLVWKSTDSLARLGVIMRAIEDCRAVRIIRHPCAYVASVMRGEAEGKFVASVRTSEDYGIMHALIEATRARGRRLTLDHMRRLTPVERMAWIWVLMNEKAEDDTRGDPRCASVRYEDVCRHPLAKTQDMFAFCGLEWNSQTLDFIRASTLERPLGGLNRITQDSRRYYSIFRNPLQAAEKWKSEMKLEDVERIFQIVGESDLSRVYPHHESESAFQAS